MAHSSDFLIAFLLVAGLLAPPSRGQSLETQKVPVEGGGAKVVLDTHSVALDGVAFEQAVALRAADGAEVPPSAVEQASGSGHHRQGVLVFPPLPQPGSVRIVVRNVGGVAERTFLWEGQ